MSLDWDLREIKDRETLCWIKDGDEERLNPVTEAIIWKTIAVDIGRITEENYKEFAARTHVWEEVFGKSLRQGGQDLGLTVEDIKAHIGLSTNVSNRTRAQWQKRLSDTLLREADNWVRRQQEKVVA